MRQDLTVQHIEDALAIDTYETHARIALESHDLNEFNQCQTQLFLLYESKSNATSAQNRGEFTAYRILYLAFTGRKGKTDLLEVIRELEQAERGAVSSEVSGEAGEADDEVQLMIAHAQKVRCAFARGNYVRFFRLQREARRMAIYLMQQMAATMRLDAMRSICRAYRPTAALPWLAQNLGFDEDCVKLRAWFVERGAPVRESSTAEGDAAIDTKAAASFFATAAPLSSTAETTGVGAQIVTTGRKYSMAKGTVATITSESEGVWLLDNGKSVVKKQLGAGWTYL
jgi:hypothetical protein